MHIMFEDNSCHKTIINGYKKKSKISIFENEKMLALQATPVLDLVCSGDIINVHTNFEVNMRRQICVQLALVGRKQEHNASPELAILQQLHCT